MEILIRNLKCNGKNNLEKIQNYNIIKSGEIRFIKIPKGEKLKKQGNFNEKMLIFQFKKMIINDKFFKNLSCKNIHHV